ncbi:methionine ABC transporter ATP-binding protein [Peptoniphilus sp. AGMB00490]|uniref:Methionine ABC transporter ATP-binding protein n=1 Tax=Peptoniphilus faecalis TaxID=2731255 RepID=A0A848RGT4_9FIRM|nr:methionine ABC transporter ATP-binding protein [Peptoniphilus faecalis]NMW85225.1 methionine ABC transporter ATP-binding protein [Peptoniphilus faecalis]
MIEVRNLVKEFKTEEGTFRAIDDISFKVKRGEIFGVIGLSGAGKSTLVRCINRLEEPTRGDILVDGKSIINLSEKELRSARKDMGMIFQHFNLFMQKTVAENIAYPLEISSKDKGEIEKRVEELLNFIDLREKKNSYPSELSGGQKQRVAIARAIATNPSILLSDEGTSALDPANTESVLNLLKKIVKEFNMTIVMITHQMEVAKEICDRIAVMQNGKIIEENETKELFRNPKSSVTRSFIKNLEDEVEEGYVNSDDYKGDVLRLSYADDNYDKPILSKCVKKFDVDVSILSGNINKLNISSVGYLTVQILGKEEERVKAIDYLKENNVNVEVL